MVATSFLSTLFLALAVAAKPVERRAKLAQLPFTKHVGDGDVLMLDRRRVDGIKRMDFKYGGGISSPADNRVVSYIASVGVGRPPTYFDLIIDLGSSNTWIGYAKYVTTSTSHQTSDSVSVSYGSGAFSGTEFIDQVTIAPELVIPKQSIGVASSSRGFTGVDGILGLGPLYLTLNTLFPDTTSTIPTVTDNLFKEGDIRKDVLSISFEPLTDPSPNGTQINGKLTWGRVDYFRFIGEITYTPITSTSPAKLFWGIDASMTYGNAPLLSSTAGIVDTGTTLVLIATNAFQTYQKATGGVPDLVNGLLKITTSQYEKLKSVFVHVNGVPFELTRNAQIWPRQLNPLIGGPADSIYLIVADIGTESGSGLDFILGQTFLERFYSVYDTAKSRVGLARTSFTHSEVN